MSHCKTDVCNSENPMGCARHRQEAFQQLERYGVPESVYAGRPLADLLVAIEKHEPAEAIA